ncbi:polyamine ABC transporter substrate-binding protein [Spartinivicinus poritis]|uniref:Putrescine-binding periplasmic protein n=1 Tax=Spartinivicinus poritis TaxID=2994640 RepID=A0ABT5UFX6_9GAMM|nr:polyamine ABC transporter substrate-binding protein [Spartinivicinus sp. A2-2]MDE1465288.1 polyamine ABC transporter substrate-binding protein [Spartinivicinus sp. A2-2]
MRKLVCGSLAIFASQLTAGQLNFYNWNDYIDPEAIPGFEKQTGVKVNYDVFDNNEVLEAKLLSGQSGYDLVVPTHNFLRVQIKAGAFQPLDKTKLTNYQYLNKHIMKELAAKVDPGNKYSIPYLEGTTGIGYNPDKVQAVLGTESIDSWAIVFEPENMKKLSKCGVAFLDSGSEIFPIVLKYLGKDPSSSNVKDYKVAEKQLANVGKYVTYYHSARYISDLANGDICVAIGWSGDVFQARDRATEAKNGVKINYVIPKEGAPLSFDMLAIPKDAKNVANAHQFLNYLLEPKVIAGVTNYVKYASPNDAAKPLIDEQVATNPGIYPSSEVGEKLFLFTEMPKKIQRFVTRSWTKIKTGR